jgi:hypothetical protein
MEAPMVKNLVLSPIRGVYRHYKGGHYEVLGTARHTETEEELVVYRTLETSADLSLPDFWVRPTAMFHEEVQFEGVQQPRFRKLENA